MKWSWLMLACVALLGCEDGEPTGPETPTTVKTETPDIPRTAPRVDGAEYSEAWLVILASSAQPGETPAALATILAEPEAFPGATPIRLDSSRYKGLMPCFEVVAALATPEQATARALSEILRERGLDHYIKNTGRWVGERPAVEESCARQARGESSHCPGGLRFFEVWKPEIL